MQIFAFFYFRLDYFFYYLYMFIIIMLDFFLILILWQTRIYAIVQLICLILVIFPSTCFLIDEIFSRSTIIICWTCIRFIFVLISLIILMMIFRWIRQLDIGFSWNVLTRSCISSRLCWSIISIAYFSGNFKFNVYKYQLGNHQ